MAPEQDQRSGAYERFGAYVRNQRQMAQLTLRQLADLASISNPYLSQIERGLHQPSVAVIRSIADALNLSADVLLAQVAGLDPDAVAPPMDTEAAIKADARLTSGQKSALLSVYRTMVAQADPRPAASTAPPAAAERTPQSARHEEGRPAAREPAGPEEIRKPPGRRKPVPRAETSGEDRSPP
jgi:transcriptional regulator with XRE-family HTH domain